MENFVRVYQNAYSADYCNQVIEFFELACASGFGKIRSENKHIADDLAINLPSSEIILKFPASTSLLNKFLNPFISTFYNDYVLKFSVLTEQKQQSVYDLKIQKTSPGGGIHNWHCENAGKKVCARLAVFSLYLNTIEEGGETEFLYYGLRVKPEQGTLIIWPAGFTHTHRGNPPLKETKYIITGWVESDEGPNL